MGNASTNRSASSRALSVRLLAWYDAHRRKLPWRAAQGVTPDPYRVWLSEIMLQQTTVASAGSYYSKFLARWPTLNSLATASLDDVLAAWSGLGYYARARNLHRAARLLRDEYGGTFPRDVAGLSGLPGVGTYTAGAIAAIAFGAREAAVDANAERVLARFFALGDPLPKAKRKLRELAQSLVPRTRSGDFAQAMMDLGALVCTPRNPACEACPWARHCLANAQGIVEQLPRKPKRKPRPLKRGAAFVARDPRGAILLERRPDEGLLGGMLQPPMTSWGGAFPDTADALNQAPFAAPWKKRTGTVVHGFTHFELELEVYRADLGRRQTVPERQWIEANRLHTAALPTVVRKILEHAGISRGR